MSIPNVEVLPARHGGTGIAKVDQVLPLLDPVVTGSLVSLFRVVADYRREQQQLVNDFEKIVKKYQLFRDSMHDTLARERMSRDMVALSLKAATRLSIKFKNPDIFKEARRELRDFIMHSPDFTGAAIAAMRNMDD